MCQNAAGEEPDPTPHSAAVDLGPYGKVFLSEYLGK